jgi:hypothetical protein
LLKRRFIMEALTTEVRVRTELRLAPSVSGDQQRDELAAFVTVCASRISRQIGGVSGWDVYLVAGMDGQADVLVRAQLATGTVESRASGCEPAMALWNAMALLEQPLREATAGRMRAA